jgi:hypothetical protein
VRITERDGKKAVILGGAAAFNARLNIERLGQLSQEIEKETARHAQFKEIDRILRALSNTWYDRSPRNPHYRPVVLCWFQKDGTDVYVEELLPEGIEPFSGSEEDWQLYHFSLKEPDMQPCFLHPKDVVVSFEEVDRTVCPVCNREGLPVVKCYEDRPLEEQRWLTRLLIICPNCEKTHVMIKQLPCTK